MGICNKGHAYTTKTCSVCKKISNSRWEAANKERHRAYQAKWREKNKDRLLKKTTKWNKEHSDQRNMQIKKVRTQNPNRVRDISLRANHGISLDAYNTMLSHQNGVCAICGQKETIASKKTGKVSNLAVDHCHKTGQIRGLLCFHCNRGIGHFKDEVIILENAANYIKKSKGTNYV